MMSLYNRVHRLKVLLLIFLLSLGQLLKAQLAVIQDDDGYSNLRAEPWGEAEILHRIPHNYVFWYDPEPIPTVEDWVRVMVPRDPYSFSCSAEPELVGYLHRSRLQPLNNLPRADSSEAAFRYIMKPFDPENRIIDSDEKWIVRLNGRTFWGLDGIIPTTEVQQIVTSIGDRNLNIHPVFYSDLFQCSNDVEIYHDDTTYFVYSPNSDGAGYYEVVWVITQSGLQQRLVGSPF